MNALEKYLSGGHHKTCTWHRFSDQEERKCSCGWIEAMKMYESMKFQIEMVKDEEY